MPFVHELVGEPPRFEFLEKAGLTGAVGAGAASAVGLASAKGIKGLGKKAMQFIMQKLIMRRIRP